MANLQCNTPIPKLYTIYPGKENQLQIEQLQVILEHLKWQQQSSESKLARNRYNLSSARADLFQILGLFFVFQGVVITVVSQSNTLNCGNGYFLSLLSLFVCFVALLAARQKLLEASELEEECKKAKQLCEAVYRSMDSICEEGVHVHLENCIPPLPRYIRRRSIFFRKWVWSYAGAVLGLILLFSAITFVSIRRVLCDAKQPGQ